MKILSEQQLRRIVEQAAEEADESTSIRLRFRGDVGPSLMHDMTAHTFLVDVMPQPAVEDCGMCGKAIGIGYRITDHIWRDGEIHWPEYVCMRCFDNGPDDFQVSRYAGNCGDCGGKHNLYHITKDAWEMAVPENHPDLMLCLACVDDRLRTHGTSAGRVIEFIDVGTEHGSHPQDFQLIYRPVAQK